MSLDVYLTGEPKEVNCICPTCYHLHKRDTTEKYYSSNITHNLNQMADAAGIYNHLWRPDEFGITKAQQLIEPLTKGLADLNSRPEYYSQFNAKNGWGTYDQFVPWVVAYLAACKEHPEARVRVSR